MDQRQRAIALTGLALLFLAGCGGEVPLTATEGATLFITANPTAIPVFEGVSTITVVGFKAVADGGGPLTDGTQIFFTTDVGTIEERVEMQNGVARGTLRSNGRAGRATVIARSGAGIFAPLEGDARVLIGNAEGINILLTANPPTLTSPNFTTELVATVFDNSNNRMSDVPIIFTTSAGALASASTSLRTNANGQATDRLTLLNEDEAKVTAISGAIKSNEVTVSRATPLPKPIITSISPSSSATRGSAFTVTINGTFFQDGAVVGFTPGGIVINSTTFVSTTQIQVNITIDSSIPSTPVTKFDITVTNPDGQQAIFTDAFTAN